MAYKQTVLAVDIDNCYITWGKNGEAQVNEDVRDFMRTWKRLGGKLIAWSGGGADYVERIVQRTGITHLVDVCAQKGSVHADFCIDDQEVNLCAVNFQLPGNIIAEPWMASNLPGYDER